MTPRHLLTVWNPSYAEDAMDAHLRVLLGWAARRARGEAEEDDDYVWWARLRSPNRQAPLPHAEEVLALQGQIEEGTETHLYLTDYRSLYVGHLGEVTADPVLAETPGERDHMPGYYERTPADFWFRLWDIRRLVPDDTPAVIRELRRLRNVRYYDRPVSLYGGMVDLPLIVTRDEEAGWFADETLLAGRTWAEHDAELRSQTARLAAELRDNLLGAPIWDALEPATRTFLCTAEAVFRGRRDDPGFDFAAPAVEYAKAVEVELNALLFPALRRSLGQSRPHERSVRLDGRPLDLGGAVPHQGLGALRGLLAREETVAKGLRAGLPHDAGWMLGELPARLESLMELRNPAAHGASLGSEVVGRARTEILGIGCEGLLVRLGRAKLRARADHAA